MAVTGIRNKICTVSKKEVVSEKAKWWGYYVIFIPNNTCIN